ncbi:carbohydrate kinase [Streptomyces sp. H10-C2]|uniref:carbohydrate kinase family protein n=1 Tax=unclassified Streptomyces TaxID=2593676 RepID=UPI0024BAFBAB|nr:MULTISPECIES: carbohydrate kinase [unclassified Streptomyces]MDJ0340721.1 carbohydrate kinase [Streptomyces sp. PH10-H1]MDJ0372007.1 carbohydrate kinase [Streptomyces sp. H10-C2]
MSPTRPVIVLGECVADAFAVPRSGDAAAGLELNVVPGGGPANTAVALARLGTPARFLGRLSGDVFGRLFREHLAGSGVDLSGCPDAAESSTLAVADLDAAGRASYSFHAEGTADWQWTAAELTAGLPADPGCLHTGSLALVRDPGADRVEELLDDLRPRATISIDPNVRPRLVHPDRYRERLPRWCAAADILRLSDDDLALLHPGTPPERACDDWHALGVPLVVITLGPKGALASLNGERVQVPAQPSHVVDTVGAGDAFMAGLLHHLHSTGQLGARLTALTPTDVHAALTLATTVAAATCAARGANPPWADQLPAFR